MVAMSADKSRQNGKPPDGLNSEGPSHLNKTFHMTVDGLDKIAEPPDGLTSEGSSDLYKACQHQKNM